MVSRPLAALFLVFALSGCPSSPPSTTPDGQPPDASPPADTSAPSAGGGARPSLSAEDCKARGGTVVGDIGDGAIHRPDYKCASGGAPIGNVTPPDGGPIPIEGAVCCLE